MRQSGLPARVGGGEWSLRAGIFRNQVSELTTCVQTGRQKDLIALQYMQVSSLTNARGLLRDTMYVQFMEYASHMDVQDLMMQGNLDPESTTS